jgi:hypothetical protein
MGNLALREKDKKEKKTNDIKFLRELAIKSWQD